MADENSPSSKPRTPLPEASSNHENHPSKFYSHFLYKAAFVTVFLVLLPLFPCEIIKQSENSRSWELLQLIFVGIAVSYGLFSKKNDEVEKDHGSKHDNAQSYVSKLLQVSSVFDDESENSTTVIDENRVQTWNSQYYREEPVVVVAKENPNIKEDNCVSLGVSKKPLLLPVRSLKQRVPEPNETDLVNDSGGKNSISRSSSNSSSKRFSTNLSIHKNREIGGQKNSENLEKKTEDNVVLRSPIPWRSRSGRMENGENSEFRLETRSFKPDPSPKTLSPSQSSSSPKKMSNSASFSLESLPKINEDVVRKKKFSSPPPPPPPPPPFPPKYLKKSNSSMVNTSSSSEKEFKRSIRSLPREDLSDNETDELPRRTSPGSESRDRIVNDGLAKSVRAFKSSEPFVEAENKSNKYDIKFSNEEHNKFFDKVLVETTDDDDDDDEGEDEDNNFVGSSGNEEEAVNGGNGDDPGPDVDKKADEFIAKFREQIRLQRIDSFRRSTADRTLKT